VSRQYEVVCGFVSDPSVHVRHRDTCLSELQLLAVGSMALSGMCPLHKARHYGHGPSYTYIFILDGRARTQCRGLARDGSGFTEVSEVFGSRMTRSEKIVECLHANWPGRAESRHPVAGLAPNSIPNPESARPVKITIPHWSTVPLWVFFGSCRGPCQIRISCSEFLL
jgi:hypothetical protein